MTRLERAIAEIVELLEDLNIRTRVLPLDTSGGIRADLIFALLPFELEAACARRPSDAVVFCYR